MDKILLVSILLLTIFFVSASEYAINTMRVQAEQKVRISSTVTTVSTNGLPLSVGTPMYNPSINPTLVFLKIKSEPGSFIRINGVDRSYVDESGILEAPLTLEDKCSGENVYSIVSMKEEYFTQKQLYINAEC